MDINVAKLANVGSMGEAAAKKIEGLFDNLEELAASNVPFLKRNVAGLTDEQAQDTLDWAKTKVNAQAQMAPNNEKSEAKEFILRNEKKPSEMGVAALITAICSGNKDDDHLDALEQKTNRIPFIVLQADKSSWDVKETIAAWEHNKDNMTPDRYWGPSRQRLLTVTEARAKTSPAHPLNPNKKLPPSDPWLTARTDTQRELVAFRAYRGELSDRDDDAAYEAVVKEPLPRSWLEAQADWDVVQNNDPTTTALVKGRLVYRPFAR